MPELKDSSAIGPALSSVGEIPVAFVGDCNNGGSLAEQGVALDRAGVTVFRGTTSLAAGPASERCR
jgi:hypothetical protein